jgi:rRNA maturation protein Nop10
MTGFSQAEPVANKKGTWYHIYISECPLCGRGEYIRTRMPAPAPKNPQDRYEFVERWDYCSM